MRTQFGENLKRIRMNKNLNQNELAEMLGYKQVTISSWENGRTEPSMGDISKISNILECSQSELLGIHKELGEITFNDILVKLNTLSIAELNKIIEASNNQLKILVEIQNLEMQKQEYERRLALYNEKLAELKHSSNVAVSNN